MKLDQQIAGILALLNLKNGWCDLLNNVRQQRHRNRFWLRGFVHLSALGLTKFYDEPVGRIGIQAREREHRIHRLRLESSLIRIPPCLSGWQRYRGRCANRGRKVRAIQVSGKLVIESSRGGRSRAVGLRRLADRVGRARSNGENPVRESNDVGSRTTDGISATTESSDIGNSRGHAREQPTLRIPVILGLKGNGIERMGHPRQPEN